MRALRWRRLALIPQGAMNSLNPVARVRDQLGDAIVAHLGPAAREGLPARVRDLLGMVGLPARAADLYPHELSGGMKQRVCIAMAVSLEPLLIIADEPTSALDVVVQRVVAQTLIEVSERLGAALILIGHDMGLQAQLVDRLGVMYAGKMVEQGSIRQLLKAPSHPYTALLTSSLPSLKERKMPRGIPGLPPSLLSPPDVCLFHPRCPHAMEVCRAEEPPPLERAPRHVVACHWANGDGGARPREGAISAAE
jgi:peptide/nickel transport system ATP-binding protein